MKRPKGIYSARTANDLPSHVAYGAPHRLVAIDAAGNALYAYKNPARGRIAAGPRTYALLRTDGAVEDGNHEDRDGRFRPVQAPAGRWRWIKEG
jgi:hypothetical protein